MRTVAERLAGKAAVVQIETGRSPHLAARFGVRGIPVTILLREGNPVDRLEGAQTAEAVISWFRRKQ